MWKINLLFFPIDFHGDTFILAVFDQEMVSYEFFNRFGRICCVVHMWGDTNIHINLTQDFLIMSSTMTLVPNFS